MKKVLIITYYWPPCGGSGVLRWLKFTKYLRRFNWEPIIYTPLNAEQAQQDNSLLKDIPEGLTVLKTPIKEPYGIYKKFIGQKKEEKINVSFLSENKKRKFSEKIAIWVRGNFFIPDAKFMWIKPSVRFLTNYLSDNSVDAIVSTGPPHSLHVIARKVAKQTNIPWLADFRDPWTNIDFYKELMLTPIADRIHRKLEKSILKSADAVVCISEHMKEEFLERHQRNYHVITNGFDEDDYKDLEDIVPDKKFSIAHIGTIAKSRNPKDLWKVLKELTETSETFSNDLEIKIVGKADVEVWEDIERFGLKKHIKRIDNVPHADALRLQKESQVLLLSINEAPNSKGILTNKFFEYMASQRPILCIGPIGGDADKILNETKTGLCSDFKNFEKLKKNILCFYEKYKSNELSATDNTDKTINYSRYNLTKDLVAVLNNFTAYDKNISKN